ncbi:MAG: hypothetical protein ACYDAI_02535 [Trichloromonadaceae bacterium]
MENIKLRPRGRRYYAPTKTTPKPYPALDTIARSLVQGPPEAALETARREILAAIQSGGLRSGLALAIRLSQTFPQIGSKMREIARNLAKKWRAIIRHQLEIQAAQAALSARERRRAEAEATEQLAAVVAALAWLRPWEEAMANELAETFSAGLALVIDRLSPAGPGAR